MQGKLTIQTFATELGSKLRIVCNGSSVERIQADVDLDLSREVGTGRYRAELWKFEQPRTITNHVVIK